MSKFGIRDDINFSIFNTKTNEKVLDIDMTMNDEISVDKIVRNDTEDKLIPMTIEANGDLKFTTYIDKETYNKLMKYREEKQ